MAISLRPYQTNSIEATFQAWRDGYRSVVLVCPTGCHAAGQKIVMFDGSTKAAEDVVVGDKLLGPDSLPRTVLCLHHGADEMMRIVPIKGDPFVVNRQHVLTLARTREDSNQTNGKDRSLVDMTVDEWTNLSPWMKHLHKLVRSDGVEFSGEKRRLSVSPYFLGVVLGDGHIGKSCVSIRTADYEVLEEVAAEADKFGTIISTTKHTWNDTAPSYAITSPWSFGNPPNRLLNALRRLGVSGCNAGTKFIPHTYKIASRSDRLELLAGLMDTDGHLSNSCYDYISKSVALAEDVAFVARSVGLAAYVMPCEKRSQNGGGGTYYRVSISGDISVVPCRIPRKIAPSRNQKKSVLRTGFKAESLGHGEYFGFMVDGDGRYLMDDFTITHNSGKRLMALWLMEYASQANRKVLFVGNRRLLITQAQADAEKHEIPFGVIMADNECGDAGASNQLASIQTLESWYFRDKWSNALTGTGLPPADLIIVDEVHQDLTRINQLIAFYPDAKVLGLTATPVGPEGTAIVPRPYDRLVEGVKNSELIRDGFLLPTTVYAPSEPNIEGVRLVKRGEYNQSQLGRAVQECTVFADVFSEWQQRASDRATVAFVPGIPFGRDLVKQFNFLLGPGSAYLIEAKTKYHEREEIFEKVKEGRARVIVSVDVLKEGFDLPVLSCGIDLQPNSQLRSYWQKLGRIKRPYGGQNAALWLDFAGNYWKFPHPNQDPEWPTGDETTQDTIKKARTKGEASQPIMCPQCGMVREGGAVCKGCGFKAEGAIRRIRMGNGKLKEIPAHAKEKVEKSESEKLFAKWQQRLFGALKSGISYAQCAEIFRRETGKYPLPHWVGVFPKDSVQAKQHPKRHFTTGSLAAACRQSPK